MIEQLFKTMKINQTQQTEQRQSESFRTRKIGVDDNVQFQKPPLIQSQLHQAQEQEHQNQQPIDQLVLDDIKAIMNTAILKSKKTYSKEYIPLGSIVDNSYLKLNQLKNLHFQHIYLNSVNQDSLHKVVFKHNQQRRQIRFYIPTFLRFSLIKLHSEDLKNITHIQNKNNLIIYINVYTKGLPKMFIDKLTKKSKNKQNQQDPKLLFRANRHLFQAKYYTSYNDYLIFMFNPFSQKMIEFQIMKNVMFAPFQEAQLILHIRINKKVFKLERSKTLRISKSAKEMPFEPQSPVKRQSAKLDISIDQKNSIPQEDEYPQSEQYEQYDILHFNKIILQFKLQKPKNIVDSFRFHKSIQFGNYGIMTNQINIHIGTYESPQKKKELQQEKASLNIDEQDLHQAQLQDISSLRLSIGLYKHPVTDLCTFFIPVTLAGGLTLLLFHLCDHSLVNQLQVLAIILVAYGAFIPQFRDRISMSRTVIFVDFYIVYNMIPAVLCALQSITESRHKKTYNSYEVISLIMYYISVLFLIQIYFLYLYVDTRFFRSHTKEMVHNFDTQIFETQQFEDDQEKYLSWFVLKNQKQRAFFCERQDPVQRKPGRKFTRKQTQFSSKLQEQIEDGIRNKQNDKELGESLALEIRLSSTNRNLRQVKQSQEEEYTQQHQQHEYLYRTKVIENQRHIHSFEKVLRWKVITVGILTILGILGLTIALSWSRINEILSFEDLNRNCIHDDEEEQRLSRIQSIINREDKLGKLIEQSWDDTPNPENQADELADEIQQLRHRHHPVYSKHHKKDIDISQDKISRSKKKSVLKSRNHHLRESLQKL